MKIKRNIIRCKICDTKIESRHRHDFKYCSCGQTFIDGGTDYVRYGGEPENVEVLTEYYS
jgi:hypothetical protein